MCTKGDWHVLTEKEWDKLYKTGQSRFKAIGTNKEIVAQTYAIDSLKNKENAKLIAAAPNLLEALIELKGVVDKFGIREPNNMTQCFGAFNKATQAINKVKGG